MVDFTEEGFILSFECLMSSDWEIRNAGALIFTDLLSKVLPLLSFGLDISSFFSQYQKLLNYVLNLIQQITQHLHSVTTILVLSTLILFNELY